MDAAAHVRSDFALEAMRLLQDGKAEMALELAANGVRSYPTYLGGYAVLADCYSALLDESDALVILAEASRRFPGRAAIAERTARVKAQEAHDAVQEHSTPAETASPTDRLITRRRQRLPAVVERHESPLRVIELGGEPSDDRLIRSSSMRLIPGLEYTSLRFEGQRRSGRSISPLPEPPAFRSFNKPAPGAYSKVEAEAPRKVSLEELADRIGKVRMTADELEKKPPAPDPLAGGPKRSLVTETLANIYLQQKAFDKAIDAYTQLMEADASKQEHFQALINKAVAQRDAAS